ncbi:biotin/lipoate--protein ligase family protein [Roseomonas sp. BN140053]|uniref:biotin/lipoate--protein ligase family protein n=1 Tax=Roseomonas sp. BN140053 TaxID=3391898 RepID=UPI0039E85A73
MTRETGALPDLPSLFEPVPLREGADALAHAAALAPSRGAGTLPWVRSASRVEAAAVLEPELPLRRARIAILAAASAALDALAAVGPPELPMQLRWPGTLTLDGAAAGAVRLLVPDGAAEDAPPPWLAVGVELRLSFPAGTVPGRHPHLTSLEEQGFEDLDAAALTAAWARHLMATLHDWEAGGFSVLAERVLARLQPEDWMDGACPALDLDTGDLLLDRGAGRGRHALGVPVLAGAEPPETSPGSASASGAGSFPGHPAGARA